MWQSVTGCPISTYLLDLHVRLEPFEGNGLNLLSRNSGRCHIVSLYTNIGSYKFAVACAKFRIVRYINRIVFASSINSPCFLYGVWICAMFAFLTWIFLSFFATAAATDDTRRTTDARARRNTCLLIDDAARVSVMRRKLSARYTTNFQNGSTCYPTRYRGILTHIISFRIYPVNR